jgi:hypothetical protein
MARRLYICQIVYDENTNTNSPVISEYTDTYYVVAERNRNWRKLEAKVIVVADMTIEQHAVAVADPRIVHLPLERIVGRLAADNDTIADLTATQRNAIRTRLEALGIDLSDVQGNWTILRFLREMRDRIHALQAQDQD